MTNKRKHITIFEHQSIKLNQVFDGIIFDESKLAAFQSYYGTKGCSFFSLIHKGIRFNQYVGVIQVGDLLIEVLPKADNNISNENEEVKWRNILIAMVKSVGSFDIKSTSVSQLKIKPNTILDLYFEMFIKEVEYLQHNGLVKKYHQKEGNVTALKGTLQFSKHIQQNLTHKERFYVKHVTYDVYHNLHSILYKTIRLLKHINTNQALSGRIGSLLLNFPEMSDINATDSLFRKNVFNRKTIIYKKSIEIARLLLLQYHPDVSKGRDDLLALMFDMNDLWEQFIYVSLHKHKEFSTTIKKQTPKLFWKPKNGKRTILRPDILIKTTNGDRFVLDTKWKNLNGSNPSGEDLRQMFAYHKYFDAKKVAMVYPHSEINSITTGKYFDPKTNEESSKECSIISLSVNMNIKDWQKNISDQIEFWFTYK